MSYTKWSKPIGCYALAKNCEFGLGKSCHCQTWLECRFSWNKTLQRRKIWTSKSTIILKENAGKVESVFVIRSAQWAKNLGCCLRNIAGVEKYARKTCDCGQPGGHSIWVLNGKPKRLRQWKFVSLWSVILKSVWNSVEDTIKLRCSWPWAVVSCTLLAAVPWTGLEHSHRKARLCIYLTLRSDVLIFRIPKHQSVCQEFFASEKIFDFIKWINLINILFIGFVKQRLSAYQDQFCVWFVWLDCRLQKERNGFSFLFPARLCFSYMFNGSTVLFLYLSFAQSCKILSEFSKLSAILKHRGKKICNDDVNRASVL